MELLSKKNSLHEFTSHLVRPRCNSTTRRKVFRLAWQQLIETQQPEQSIFQSLNLYMKNSAGKMPANSRGTITTGTNSPAYKIWDNYHEVVTIRTWASKNAVSNNQSKLLHQNSISTISDFSVFKQKWDYNDTLTWFGYFILQSWKHKWLNPLCLTNFLWFYMLGLPVQSEAHRKILFPTDNNIFQMYWHLLEVWNLCQTKTSFPTCSILLCLLLRLWHSTHC